jgi:outer membrane immunogenic protein
VTGRVGYAWDRFLAYVKGGVAWERDNYDFSATFNGVQFFGANASQTRTGWTVGVGGEYAFTDYLTGFVEGDYYDFGTVSTNFTTFPVVFTFPIDIKERKFVAKAGFNWKFNWGAPAAVVTRY